MKAESDPGVASPRRVFVVLPIYNEEFAIREVVDGLFHTGEALGVALNVVAVDDGSIDATESILAEYGDHPRMTMVRHRLNRGLGETIRDGFEEAAELAAPEDVIIRMDADNTHDPKHIPDLLAAIDAGADVAICSRYVKGGGYRGPSGRTWISAIARVCFRTFFPMRGLREYTCGFRAYRANLVKQAINLYGDEFVSLRKFGFCCTVEKLVKLNLLGAKIVEIPFEHRYDRKKGESKMVFNLTVLGYIVMILQYYWPHSGWRWRYRRILNSMRTS